MAYEPGKRLTKRLAELTGKYRCTNCQKEKPLEGGKTMIALNGSKRWKCKDCLAKRIAPIVGTRGADSMAGGVT